MSNNITSQIAMTGKVTSMTEALSLDPLDYSGSYKLIGGRAPLDLVNTISWEGTERQHDWLSTTSNVVIWLRGVGVEPLRPAESDILKVQQLRAILRQVLQPLAHQAHPSKPAVERFNSLLVDVLTRRYIDPVDLAWTWEAPLQFLHVFDPIVYDAGQILTSAHDRLRHCPSCGWIFEDKTRNGRRRWCDMADCGSRAKARSYYHRQRSQDT